MDSAMERNAGGALEVVRSATGNAQATLADTLDAGASALRERFGAPNDRGVRARLGAAGGAVAGRLESSALWLRENDITDLRELLGHQLENHPGRTALIALGIGVLIGRASKR
ncbi:MAG TPA: hypothetical protein VJW73_20415 [Gemmatimonadaceae bacterium]|nr:hypothetical protein [Gemmatimonadaceae bacterium]